MKRASLILIIRRRPGETSRVLAVTNRKFGGLTLPGGKVEEDEDVRFAGIRELKEETGVTVLSLDLLRVAESVNVARVDGALEECLVSIFFARHMMGEAREVEDGTHIAWVSWHELIDLSPFATYYTHHFPEGVEHLRATIIDRGPPGPPPSS